MSISRLPRFVASTLFMAGVAAIALPAHAAPKVQNGCNMNVRFAPGTSAATVRSQIKGDRFCEYRLRGMAGQSLQASLQGPSSLNAIVYDENSTDLTNGDSYVLPSNGVYKVRVLQTRNDVRKSRRALPFMMTLSIR